MFDKLFDMMDGMISSISGRFETIVLIGIILAIVTVIIGVVVGIFIFFDLTGHGAPSKQETVAEGAGLFCEQKGFGSWEWVNETDATFRCITSPEDNGSVLDKYYVS